MIVSRRHREYTLTELVEDDHEEIQPDPQNAIWISFQRHWLKGEYAKNLRQTYGWDRPFRRHSTITMRDLYSKPLPNWHTWLSNPYPCVMPAQPEPLAEAA